MFGQGVNGLFKVHSQKEIARHAIMSVRCACTNTCKANAVVDLEHKNIPSSLEEVLCLIRSFDALSRIQGTNRARYEYK